ncbi:MFS transporter [Tersicoccus phoenicis]|uniref:MFS transporter n=1 Tax=Tersicoccus phoenicis TaxID=554083 RepID=A0A1R1LL29_9MICC|nr:MFS transporter [Tersicoccus phoenicis]OMH28257.1 MFS transporter [Tersicoccus phoenicis]
MDTDPATTSTESTGADPGRWRILAVLLVAIFMSLVSVSSVNVALPSIQSGLGATASQLQWVLSGYALTFGVVLVAAGRAGDILGRGPLFITGVVVFTLASIWSGLAADPTMLVIARFIQGIGSGLLNPQGVGMIQQYFRGAERGRAFGAFGSAVGVSVGVGPLLGGLLIQFGGPQEGWRWIFFINVPVGILAIVLALLWFPRPLVVRSPGRTLGGLIRALDPVGALLLGVAIFAVLLPFMEARAEVSGWLWALVPVGVILAAAWIAWERNYRRRGNSSMVDLGIFRTSSFSRGAGLIALYFLGVTSVWVLVALFFQEGLGHTPLESGLIGLPNAAASALSATWAGRRVMRLGRRLVLGGMASVLLGLGLSVAVIELHGRGLVSEWWLLLTLMFVGLGQGAVVSPNQTLTLAEVPLEYAGSAGGVMQTGQRVGTSVGIAVITAVAFTVLDAGGWANAISIGFGLVALVLLLALTVGLVDERARRRSDRGGGRTEATAGG